MHLKVSGKWRTFCLGLNVLRLHKISRYDVLLDIQNCPRDLCGDTSLWWKMSRVSKQLNLPKKCLRTVVAVWRTPRQRWRRSVSCPATCLLSHTDPGWDRLHWKEESGKNCSSITKPIKQRDVYIPTTVSYILISNQHPVVYNSCTTCTVEPLWKGQECLTKVAKFGPFPCTILYKSCLPYPSWQDTSFERPVSWVAFIKGFHCISIVLDYN